MGKSYLSDAYARCGITISAVIILKFLLTVIFVLSLCGFLVNYDRYVWGETNRPLLYSLFNMDWEGNVPTLFSAMNLFFSALLLLYLSKVEQNNGGCWHFHYLSLGILFLFLSYDEIWSLHEKISGMLSRYLHTQSLLTLGTVLFAMILLPSLVVFFWRLLLALPRRIALEMILCAVIFLMGAVGMEMVSIGYAQAQGTKADLKYQMLAIIEETLEMVGVAIFNYTLLKLLLQQKHQILFHLGRVRIHLVDQ